MKYLYGDSWEKYRIKDGETWTEAKTGSKVTVCNLINRLPRHMLEADMVYSDPPLVSGKRQLFCL